MHIHILGICGTFMGGLAALAREAGFKVTGCDTGVYPPMSDQLRALGIELIEGFGVEQLALKPDMFVIGNVVSRARTQSGDPKYPLMEAIMNEALPYVSGPQWLAENILRGRHVLAVAGTHGKTTTTAMLAWILEYAGLQPGFLIGGVPLNFGVSARLGAKNRENTLDVQYPRAQEATKIVADLKPNELSYTNTGLHGAPFVIEADEYDTAFFDKRSKFVHYLARTTVLNNLEFDHADIFDDVKAIEKQFHHLVRTVPSDGRVIYNELEESLKRVINMGCWSVLRSFGGAASDFSAAGDASRFAVVQRGKATAPQANGDPWLTWELSGTHNQLNALAAIAAAEHIGVSVATSVEALALFQNVKRRMETVGVVGSGESAITIYDDFAHHPTAIRTTLDGLKHKVSANIQIKGDQPKRRILAVFEPRSATMKLGTMRQQLPWSLESADLAFCFAGAVNWDAADALKSMGPRAATDTVIDSLVARVVASAQLGDHIVCMSNGGFGGVHSKLMLGLTARFG